MVKQVPNNPDRNRFENNDITFGLKLYDIILLLIPIFFIMGIMFTFLTSININYSITISSLLSVCVIGYCLFIDYLKY